MNQELIEQLAELEHKQWMEWAQKVYPEVSTERQNKWKTCFVKYIDLPEEEKEKDRVYARKAVKLIISYKNK